jgi:hypothetical protein
LAGCLIFPGAGRRCGEAECQPRRRLGDAVEHVERGFHHLMADAVARQHCDVEGVVGGHGWLSLAMKDALMNIDQATPASWTAHSRESGNPETLL